MLKQPKTRDPSILFSCPSVRNYSVTKLTGKITAGHLGHLSPLRISAGRARSRVKTQGYSESTIYFFEIYYFGSLGMVFTTSFSISCNIVHCIKDRYICIFIQAQCQGFQVARRPLKTPATGVQKAGPKIKRVIVALNGELPLTVTHPTLLL